MGTQSQRMHGNQSFVPLKLKLQRRIELIKKTPKKAVGQQTLQHRKYSNGTTKTQGPRLLEKRRKLRRMQTSGHLN